MGGHRSTGIYGCSHPTVGLSFKMVAGVVDVHQLNQKFRRRLRSCSLKDLYTVLDSIRDVLWKTVEKALNLTKALTRSRPV